MKTSTSFGWATKPLGDLVDVLDRFRKPITKKDRNAGQHPYYGATGVLDHVSGYLFDEPLVLIGEDGAKWEAGANTAFAIKGKTWVNNHAHVIRPHRDCVLDDWLVYYLNGVDLMPFVSGMTVPKLNQGRLVEIPIPLPPMEEQRRIVATLDEAFEGLGRARANAEANLQNARELSSASVEAVFDRLPPSTPVDKLQNFCTERGITYGVIKLGEHDPNGVPCLRTSNVRPLRIDVEGVKLIAADLSQEYRRTILEGGEVLVNVRGTLGGVCAVPDHMAGWNISREVAMVPLDSTSLDPTYASFFISTQRAQGWLTGVIKGAAYKGINLTDLRRLSIPVPSMRVQAEVVAEISNLREQIMTVEEACSGKIQRIADLRQSLLQRAFAGELT